MGNTVLTGKNRHDHYDTVGDFSTAVAKGARADEASHTENAQWSGSKSFDESVRMLRDGTWSIKDKVEAMLGDISKSLGKVTKSQPKRSYDVAGGTVNVARFLSGEPRNMMVNRLVKLPKVGRRVTVLAHLGASGAMTVDEMLQRGTALVALCEALRMAGIGTTVHIGFGASSGPMGTGRIYSMTTEVANSANQYDMESIMFAIANPSMFRRLCFGVLEGLGSEWRQIVRVDDGTYGYPAQFPDEVVAMLAPDINVTSSMYHGLVGDPVAWIRGILTGLGVTISDV